MTNPMQMVNGVSVEMSDDDYAAEVARREAAAAVIAKSLLNNAAVAAMSDADITVSRVIEAVAQGKTTFTTADVVAFMAYRTALRPFITASSGTLPAKPPYPANT